MTREYYDGQDKVEAKTPVSTSDNSELSGYCDQCDEPISTDCKVFRDTAGNLVCSKECQRESNFDYLRDR